MIHSDVLILLFILTCTAETTFQPKAKNNNNRQLNAESYELLCKLIQNNDKNSSPPQLLFFHFFPCL